MVRNNDSGGDQNYSAEDVRTHACKILANLAAEDDQLPEELRPDAVDKLEAELKAAEAETK